MTALYARPGTIASETRAVAYAVLTITLYPERMTFLRPALPLAVLLALAASPAFAEGPNRMSILTGSNHIGATQDFEEVNPGVFADWVRDDGVTWTFGAYRNSYGRVSVAAMAGWEVYARGPARIDLFAGVANYPRDGRKTRFATGDVLPLVGVRMAWRNLFMLAIPGDGEATDAILGFGFSYGVGD